MARLNRMFNRYRGSKLDFFADEQQSIFKTTVAFFTNHSNYYYDIYGPIKAKISGNTPDMNGFRLECV